MPYRNNAPAEEADVAIASEADRVLASAVASGQIPGAVAIAVDRGGVTYAGALGTRGVGDERAMAVDTLFNIASMTKPVTAVAAMQLVEQGQLALDAPVAALLPALGAIQVLDGFDAAGAPVLRPPRRSITLRHLLTHTAGFAYPLWNRELARYRAHLGGTIPWLEAPLARDPGERWEYGTNIDWVGRLIERVAGCELEEYFRARILDPLGMSDTSYTLTPARRARRAVLHRRSPDGAPHAIASDPPDRPENCNGGGGLFSTAPDYGRFLRMFLNDGTLDGARVLRQETVAEMVRNQIGELAVEVLPTTEPGVSNDVELLPGIPKTWGLAGYVSGADAPTGRGAGSWAWGGIHNTYFWVDPAARVAGAIFTQILPFADGPVLHAFEQLERAVYQR